MGPHRPHSNTQMAPSSDQQSSTPTPTDPDLHQTPSHQSSPSLPATPTMHTHSTTPPPPGPSSGNGNPRADMEWPLLQRRDSELCPHPSSPTGSNGLERSDTNSKPTHAARTTTTAQSLSHAPNSCPSSPLDAPLSSPSWASESPSSEAEEHSGEFLQRGLPGTTSRSHFPISRSRRNKYSTEGRRTQAIHNHVLKPKPTICRVRRALGKARQTGPDVSYQGNHSEASVAHSNCGEDPDDMGDPE